MAEGTISSESLTAIQRSMLEEMGSMGTAHAATALAKLTGHAVSVKPPKMFSVPLSEIYGLFAHIEGLQLGLYNRMQGGLSGCIVFFVPKAQSYTLVDMLAGRPLGESRVLGEMEQSILRESSGIICGAYVNSIASLAKIQIKLTPSKLFFDQRGQIFSSILEGMLPPETLALVVENAISTSNRVVNGYFIFIPRTEDLQRFFALLEGQIR